jgi:UrcA family protein
MNTNTFSTMSCRRRTLAILAPALLGCALTAAMPAAAQAPTTVVVKYGDLDLTRPAGREALQTRLDSAAKRVCGVLGHPDLRTKQMARECRSAAIDQAVAALNNPAFSAWYAANTGRAVDGAQQIASR